MGMLIYKSIVDQLLSLVRYNLGVLCNSADMPYSSGCFKDDLLPSCLGGKLSHKLASTFDGIRNLRFLGVLINMEISSLQLVTGA